MQRNMQEKDREISDEGATADGGGYIPAPRLEIVGSGVQRQYQLRFLNLGLIFQVQSIDKIFTDSIVLWQQAGKLFEDYNSKQIIGAGGTLFSSDAVPKLKMELGRNSLVVTHYGSKLLICQQISLSDSYDSAKVCQLVENIFEAANSEKVASIAVPAFPHERGMKDLNNYYST